MEWVDKLGVLPSFHRHDISARFTDVELDLVGRQQDPTPLLSYLPGSNLDGNQLYSQPGARIKYDGSRWFPTSLVDSTPPKKGVVPTIRITILGGQGYRLLWECVPAFFLSKRAGLEIADFPQSMEVFEYLVQTSRGALWSAGMSYWIRVPKGSNKFLVQVDKDQLLAKFRHLEVGVRLALSEILPSFPGTGLHPVGKPSGCSQNITPYWPIQPLYNPYSYIGGICWYISQVLSQGYPTSRVPNLELALWRFPQREGFRLGTNQNLGFN